MVTRKMLPMAVLSGLLLSLLLFTPLYANDSDTLSNILGRAGAMLKPVMDTNNITISVTEDVTVKNDAQKLEERLLNLLSNALVHAPAGTEIKVSYDASSKQIRLWVDNSSVSHDIKREVVDALGNTFILETMSGKGTLYAINL